MILAPVLLALAAAACAQAQTAVGSSAVGSSAVGGSAWTNDHARLVIQSVDSEGRLTGTYMNVGPRFGCAGIVYPVTGWIDGDSITYAVRRRDRRNCTAVESWTGLIRGDRLVVDFVAMGWDGAQWVAARGADSYRRE